MRTPPPVTGTVAAVPAGETLVSRTDPRGVIVEANAAFVRISSFSESELIGQPHSIVRHPDMPAAVFADLWATLARGQPWVGVVKNRCRNGDHYWVQADVTPEFGADDALTGYLSVCRAATPAQVAAADRQYRRIADGSLRRFRIVNGAVLPPSLSEFNPLWKLSLRVRLFLLALFGVGFAVALAWAAVQGVGIALLASLVVAALAFAVFSAGWLANDLVGRLDEANRLFGRISTGRFDDPIDISRRDEVGRVLLGLKRMQTRLGYQIVETRRRNDELSRLREAVQAVDTNLMVCDEQLRISYTNASLQRTLATAEAEIRRELPGFSVASLVGRSIDDFHRAPAHQHAVLASLAGTHRTTIRIGGLIFTLAVTPVRSARGRPLGFVVEWKNRTEECAIEEEIAAMVAAAARGDFSRRLSVEGRSGFTRTLSEALNRLAETTADSLREIEQLLASMATGDLGRRIDREFEGTFGAMRRSAHLTLDQLSSLVRQIQSATATILQASREVAAGSSDLSTRTEQQAAHLQETASSMQQLTAAVRGSARQSQQARALAQEAADVAQRSGHVVGQAVRTMEAITEASNRIGEIIGVIDGISFQTNILALNAAVEAARAGEQGRGFAVVASEVRALAQRAAEAAKEIKQLIGHSITTVADGAVLVREAGSTMGDVVASVQRVSTIVDGISHAAREQSGDIEIVNRAVAQIDDTTQRNAALVEEASAAALEMEEQAAQLADTVATFRVAPVAVGQARRAMA